MPVEASYIAFCVPHWIQLQMSFDVSNSITTYLDSVSVFFPGHLSLLSSHIFFLLDEFCQELPVHLCRSPFCTLGETNPETEGGDPWTKMQQLPPSFLQNCIPHGSSKQVCEETKSTLFWVAGSCYLPCPLLSVSSTPQLMIAPSLHTLCMKSG